ncbi:catalase [Burkholderia sp. Bp9031]|nr:catalase [Burkholderia sp. Bp9031]
MTNPPPSGTPPPSLQPPDSPKSRQLDENRVRPDGEAPRTNRGLRIAGNQNTLRAGARGPSLLEDFIVREKVTHFDRERIAERILERIAERVGHAADPDAVLRTCPDDIGRRRVRTRERQAAERPA